MIDCLDRVAAIDLLNRLLSFGITNYEIDDAWPRSSNDRGVVAIGEQIWCFYDDFPETIISRKDFSQKELDIIHRCLAFLKSREEYLWPDYSFETENVRFFDYIMCRSSSIRKMKWDKFISAGNVEYWPFINKDQYEKAIEKENRQ